MSENSTSVIGACVDFITKQEGFSPTPYLDSVGKLTIGYGRTKGVKPGDKTSPDLERKSTEVRVTCIVNRITSMCPGLTCNQIVALASLAYNVGLTAVLESTLLKYVKSGEYSLADAEFVKWDHANRKEIAGLRARRLREAAIFSSK